jgi:rhodanese-related sulfurtransferase
MRQLSPAAAKPLLTDGAEIALLDVREYGQYGAGHPFFAVNLPYSRLEALAPGLLPRLTVRMVLFDDGDGVAEKAAVRLAALGYTDLTIMEGGAPAWAVAGYTLFEGVNLPSKTFGELVEHAMHTPSISAEELKAMQAAGEDFILLDGRTPAEYWRMTIPGARSCPNAELGYRLPGLGLRPETRVVVNCAGRTRSIIGAQTLRNLGVANEVVALRNGTQGWELAGFTLARGNTPEALPEPDRAAARETAQRLIASAGLTVLDEESLARQRADEKRTHYLFDVRTAEEYAAGHMAEAIHAPGGQLVQASDQWVAVRNAQIVLCDDTGLRAATTALWLRGMGHEVAILDADASLEPASPPVMPHPPTLPIVLPRELPPRLAAGAVLFDLSPSTEFRAGHIAGARWAIRPRLAALDLSGATEVLLAARDPAVVEAAAADLAELHDLRISLVPGGPEAWRAAGLALAAGPDDPADGDCIDYVFHTHDRHSGNLAAAQAYLDWETGLVPRLDSQERSVLRPGLSLPGRAG